ncbi:hypothetical protein PENSPDRAFT_736698 [Peniophora sp. CONT]|nr:hypothetical protein PENSPDRAFT_736698 [Peniophora sp. CONT]
MPSRGAWAEDMSGATVERDACINSVKDLLKQRYVQLNAEHIVGIGTVQERANLHRQLSTDIADLTAALLLWKKTATASAPVSCLPPEVLQNIFSFLALLDPPITPLRERPLKNNKGADEYEDINGELSEPQSFEDFPTWSRDDRGSLGWIKASHVCQSWRSIMLPMRSLWAGTIGILPLATRELMKRVGPSSAVHLTLRESSRRVLSIENALRLIPQTSIHSLRIYFTDENTRHSSLPDFTEYMRNVPWTALKTLDISANGTPECYFNLVAPALHSAKMLNCTMPLIAHSLRRLSIVYNRHRPGYDGLALGDLLENIHGSRSTLEELELLRCLSVHPGDKPQTSSPIHFSALRRFSFGGHSVDLIRLVGDHITYPRACDVAFHALSRKTDELYESHRDYQNPSAAFYFALRLFADELLARHAPYALVLNDQRREAPFVAVREPASLKYGGSDILAEQPEGERRVYFDPEASEHDVLYASKDMFYSVKRETDSSAFLGVQTLSVVRTDEKPTNAHIVARLFEETSKLTFLHICGYEREVLRGFCDVLACDYDHRGKKIDLVLPVLSVLRVSAGAKPLMCKDLAELLTLRTREIEQVKDAKQLAQLIVDKDVSLADPENEEKVVQQLKGLVGELRWKL